MDANRVIEHLAAELTRAYVDLAIARAELEEAKLVIEKLAVHSQVDGESDKDHADNGEQQ